MPKEPPRILAINPGSRYIGIAAFRGPELLDWRIAVVRGKTLGRKIRLARRVLLSAVQRYDPDVLAIKRLHRSRSSPRLNTLVVKTKRLARQGGLKVCQYSVQELKDSLCPDTTTNKRKLAELLAAMYPALAHDFRQETQNRNPYHTRMFEAVALGSVCNQQLENH